MAEASTARYKRNEPLSVFDGLPITAKDEVRVVSCIPKHLMTTLSSFFLLTTHGILSGTCMQSSAA